MNHRGEGIELFGYTFETMRIDFNMFVFCYLLYVLELSGSGSL
jgi:hypothetical protein